MIRPVINKIKNALNRRGFSLVEVLIAIAILAMIAVPLAMNMISSSRLNSQAKQVASSSDLTTSLMEVMQTVDLSDILIDVNGYGTDQYGTKIPYLLKNGALKKYNINNTMEVIRQDDGTFVPVTKREDVAQDYLSNSSIMIRNVGGDEKVVKAYFVGQKSGEYAFLLKGIENEDMIVDVLATITPEKTYEIVNIVSMQQTEMAFVKTPTNFNQTVADEFNKRNDTARLTNSSIVDRSPDWYLKNMHRTITVDMVKDIRTDAVTVTITALYSLEEVSDNGLRVGQATYSKKLGSFSTNSTAEFARGIFVYYNPLVYSGEVNNNRDHFIINNKNELGVPVYLVAQTGDSAITIDSLTNYKPTLEVNELSDQIYTKFARTAVCSNVKNEQWVKTLYPVGRNLEVKTLGNNSEQQTLYSMTLKVYKHRDDSYDDDGVFMPRDKDLLVETTGTFLDTSEKLDIDNDVSTGLTTQPGEASAWRVECIYNGEEQTGVQGSNVEWSGTTTAINAGTYVATATPKQGYVWPSGDANPKQITWVIKRSPTAEGTAGNKEYNQQIQVGVTGQFVEWTGTYSAKDAGKYTAYATPDSNHCWPDGTYASKKVSWTIFPQTVTITWATGMGGDTWEYDGIIHTGSYTISGIFSGDSCTANVSNITIRDVGTKEARINSLSNRNYTLPTDGSDKHILTITNPGAAYVILAGADYVDGTRALIYNGKVQNIVSSSRGVTFSGNYTARDVKTGGYTFIANLMPGYLWEDGSTGPRTFTWHIEPFEIDVAWGTRTWVYDGIEHSTTCAPSNLFAGDICTIYLSNNNFIKNVGSETVSITGHSNPNYKIKTDANKTAVIQITPAPLATYYASDFKYDGYTHTGVHGSYIVHAPDSVYSHTEVNVDANGKTISYTAYIKPGSNYTWKDGYNPSDKGYTKNADGYWAVTWTITPIIDAEIKLFDVMFDRDVWQMGAYPIKCEIISIPSNVVLQSGSAYASAIGKYTIQVKPLKNHAWRNVAGRTDDDIFVGSATVRTVTFEVVEGSAFKPSLQDWNFEYDGTQKEPLLDMISVGSANKFILSGDLTATAAGTYKIYATLKDGEKWADGTKDPVEMVWTIHPKPVTITYKSNTWTYDATEKTGLADISGLCGSDVCDFTYANNKYTHQGTYTFKLTGVTNPNYCLPETGTEGTMVIKQRTLGITWTSTADVVYDHSSHSLTASFTNVAGSDNPTPKYSTNTSFTNVGTHTVTISGINNNPYNDYILPTSGLSNSFKITREPAAAFQITVNPTYNGTSLSPTYTSHGIQIQANSTESAVNANEFTTKYVIRVKPDSNHCWPDNNGTEERTFEWYIENCPVTATAKTGLVYTGSSQTGVTFNSDRFSTFSGYTGTNAGSYTATLTPGPNYKWGNTNQVGTRNAATISWSIAKAPGFVSVAPTVVRTGVTYSGSPITLFSVSGCAGSGAFKYDGLISPTNAGTHTLEYWCAESDNYLESAHKTISATIKPLCDASFSGQTWYYNGSARKPYTLTNCYISSGEPTRTDVGSNTVTVKPLANHAWSDGTTGGRSMTYGIARNPIAKLSYDETASGVIDELSYWSISVRVDTSYCSVKGVTSKSGHGSPPTRGTTYNFRVTPQAGYAWSSGAYDTKICTWTVKGFLLQHS